MAKVRTQLVDGFRKIITKVSNGIRKISCSCCTPCDFFTCQLLLDNTSEIYPSTSNPNIPRIQSPDWPPNVIFGSWITVGTFDEEPNPPSSGDPNIVIQRDQRRHWGSGGIYPVPPRGPNGIGSCSRFLCANVVYNSQTDEYIINEKTFCGPTTTGRSLRQLLLSYVDESVWKQSRNLMFKITFYGWESKRLTENGRFIYRWHSSSDTKFTIKYAEFTITQQ